MTVKPMQHQKLHKHLLHNTFFQTLMMEQTEMTTDQMNITTDNVV